MSGKKSDFVKFEQVDKSYDGKELVVKGLDLDIAEGEFLTLLGPSGSGKTTTLMMLAGFETPTNGEIYFDGNPINNIPPGLITLIISKIMFFGSSICSKTLSERTLSK